MLTNSKIKALQPKEKAYKVSDAGGLHMQVRPNGGKYWRLKYYFMGKECQLTIGVYPNVSLLQAREARDDAKELLSQGIDPREAKKQADLKREFDVGNSFAAVTREWFKQREPTLAPATSKKNQSAINKDLIPYLGSRPITELKTFELVGCLKRIADRGALDSAHQARQLLNQIFRYAKQVGLIEHNPASDLVGAIPPKKTTHMAAITDPKRFGQLLVDIDSYKGTHIHRTALALAPLLFQRPGELCAMEWSEIDLTQALWVIPMAKKKERNQAEGDHIVPLSRQTIELLKDIQPLTGNSRYVFPNQRDHQRPIRTESLNKALRNLGYDTKTVQTVHGFRACARTMLDEQLNLRIEYIEQQLAHKVRDALGNAYNRTKHLPERKDMMQRWSDYLDDLKRQTLAGNVITAKFGV